MVKRFWILRGALIAALLAVGSIAGIRTFGTSRHDVALNSDDTAPVLVAGRYIPAFTSIKADDVRVESFPKPLIPTGALHNAGELQDSDGKTLYLSTIAIPEGQALTLGQLAGADQGDRLSSLMRPGKVAVSFEVDRAHGVGGWLRPGDSIALFHSVSSGLSGRAGTATRLLFSSIPVLAIDEARLGQTKEKSASENSQMPLELSTPTDMKIVTVLVKPSEASQLIEAREHGSISLVLRARGDDYPWPAAD